MGLLVSVYKNPLADCTDGGISSKATLLTLVNVPGPFDPNESNPAAIIESHHEGIVRIVPSDAEGNRLPGWFMAGGNYAATTDDRLSKKIQELIGHRFYGAVAIHDRLEF